jgi:CheY-like chemotaxis protein
MLQTLFTCETACYEAAKPVLEELKATIGNVTSGATHRSTSSGKQSTSTSCGTPKTYEASSGHLLTSSILISGAYTVILTDIHMPEMGGIELTREIRRDWSATILPIVGATADHSSSLREECLSVGMQELLTKPILNSQLFETITVMLTSLWGESTIAKYAKQNSSKEVA